MWIARVTVFQIKFAEDQKLLRKFKKILINFKRMFRILRTLLKLLEIIFELFCKSVNIFNKQEYFQILVN